MNHEMVNNTISRLPLACAGIVHTFFANRIGLSIFNHTINNSREDAYLNHVG